MDENRDRHLSPDEIARLAEGPNESGENDEALEHLAECRSCMAAYVDAVRYRAAWLARSEDFDSPAELVATGIRVGSAATWPLTSRPSIGPRKRPVYLRPGIMVPLGVAALFALVLLSTRNGTSPAPRELKAEAPATLQAALDATSTRGMILPGAHPLDDSADIYRGGDSSPEALRGFLDSLQGVYSAGRARPQDRRWLIEGLIAAGRLSEASTHLRAEQAIHRDDPVLLDLAGQLAYRQNDLAGAEESLRACLTHKPAPASAKWNLALLLSETGRSDEARQLIATLSPREREELGHRAPSAPGD